MLICNDKLNTPKTIMMIFKGIAEEHNVSFDDVKEIFEELGRYTIQIREESTERYHLEKEKLKHAKKQI